jgi:threonine/homoserine/homoserine lactone efflux protein
MPSVETLFAFALISATIACTPGPNMMNLLSQTASHGIRAGYVTLAGSISALILMASAAVLGLTTVLTQIPSAYLAMRLAGAGYLLYLAIRTIWVASTLAIFVRSRRRRR